MIKIYPATINTASPSLYAIEIDESIRSGFGESTIPSAVVTVANSGSPIASGSTTLQTMIFAVTLTYQPCSQSSETKVKTFAESVTIAVPGSMGTISPTIGTTSVTPTKIGCCNKAYGVKLLTSISVDYSA